jgi:septum formation protein
MVPADVFGSGPRRDYDAQGGAGMVSEPAPAARPGSRHGPDAEADRGRDRPPGSPVLILGSASPRRRELLAQIGVVPDALRAADIDETPRTGELPRDYCRRVARQKAEALVPAAREAVLTADTTVAIGRRILGKPADAAEAARFLRGLSGRRHRVLTAVVLRTGDRFRERLVETVVKVRRLSDAQIADYIASGEWQGKAGGYAIQGRFAAHVEWLSGSFTGVVGLPLAETAALLSAAGFATPVGPALPQTEGRLA